MTTLSLRGEQPGSAEADGSTRMQTIQPETAEPPKNTYTCTAESLHAAKRKEKNMNGREIKQQHYKKRGGRDTVHKQKSSIKSLHSKGISQEGGQNITGLTHPI